MTMAIALPPLSILGLIIWTLIAAEIHCTRPPDACSLCECTLEPSAVPIKVSCLNSELTSLPQNELMHLPSIRVLLMTGNNFTNLNATFSSMINLEELILSDNSIRSISLSAFHGANKLWKLDLSDNELTSPPLSSSFDQPNLIREFNLSRNQISKLDNGSFVTLTELELLDLSFTDLEFISLNAFQGLDNLRSLSLKGNRISQLTSDTFSLGLSKLSELNLDENLISDVALNTFARLKVLQTLRLSHNKLSYAIPATFEGLSQLRRLHMSHNRIRYLSEKWTMQLPQLEYLDLSGNPLYTIQQHQLSPATKLLQIDLKNMPELEAVLSGAFSELPSLKRINLQGSSRLKYLNPDMFGGFSLVESINIYGCQLQSLSRNLVIKSMPNLKHFILSHNPWRCDCSLKWLSDFIIDNQDIFGEDLQNVSCHYPTSLSRKLLNETEIYQNANCSNATVSHFIPNVHFRLGSTALLECQAEGNPKPEISWYTPVSNVLHWSSLGGSGESHAFTTVPHPSYHDSQGVPITSRRLQVLRNGNLFISHVETEDAGLYVCVAGNSLGNHTVYMSLTLDFGVLQHVKIVSILVGLAVSVAFMLLMLILQLVLMILNRWGWCCCRTSLPPKAKRIRKMLESVEHYKGQQLERLRENYNMQVQRIKDNCTQQMEKLRDSYSSQTERLRDFRDYGTHQIDRIRDQYYEQVRRVRDYSTQQMSRVRENYVVQRNRIRKFSAHQLFKLRENYKVQQLHLNKILENLNLESCRTVCARTDSVMFNSEMVCMDQAFPPDIDFPQPIPLPSSMSTDSVDIELQSMPGLNSIPVVTTKQIICELDDDDDSVIYQDAMDGSEFQLVQALQDTFIVDPNEPDLERVLRPSNNIVV
ncbi:hypothetical protein CHUAL_003038 [Chamberlinius hualienensis]